MRKILQVIKWHGETFFVPKVLRYFIFARLELWYNIGEMNDKKIVLVVGMGTAPAVMMETKKEK